MQAMDQINQQKNNKLAASKDRYNKTNADTTEQYTNYNSLQSWSEKSSISTRFIFYFLWMSNLFQKNWKFIYQGAKNNQF